MPTVHITQKLDVDIKLVAEALASQGGYYWIASFISSYVAARQARLCTSTETDDFWQNVYHSLTPEAKQELLQMTAPYTFPEDE